MRRRGTHAELLAVIAADKVAAPRQSVVWELLLREGRAAELGGELRRARELFSACHALSGRPEARLLAASMRLKLGEAEAALAASTPNPNPNPNPSPSPSPNHNHHHNPNPNLNP